MLQAYEGYLEKGLVYPVIPLVNVQDRRKVIVTVLDEPAREQGESKQAQAWREFFDAVNASNEEIPETFERVSFSREVTL